MQLPNTSYLPIQKLSACFNKTSATYKFYWFLSIIESVEKGKTDIPKIELFAKMIANAWYTVNYFHVSFGKQDLIQDTVRFLQKHESISIDENIDTIFERLVSTSNSDTIKSLLHFDKNVPHWFLTPWFPKENGESDSQAKKRIYFATDHFEEDCLYRLNLDSIQINPKWVHYLQSNSRVLKDFCYWNLALFLQSKNPNVPDIPNKLIKPAIRNSLQKQRNEYWNVVLNELGSIDCIYTGNKLTIGNFAVEHFVPYSFVSHDLIWNLIPADKSFNSTKSNKLPPLETYFDPFFELQLKGFQVVKEKKPRSKFIEEYLTIFPDLNQNFSKQKFLEHIQPLVTIASNNGFQFLTV